MKKNNIESKMAYQRPACEGIRLQAESLICTSDPTNEGFVEKPPYDWASSAPSAFDIL